MKINRDKQCECGIPPPSEAEWQRQVVGLARLLGWKVASFRTVRVQRADGRVYYETPVGADGPTETPACGGRGWASWSGVPPAGCRCSPEPLTPPGRAPAGCEVHVWQPGESARMAQCYGG